MKQKIIGALCGLIFVFEMSLPTASYAVSGDIPSLEFLPDAAQKNTITQETPKARIFPIPFRTQPGEGYGKKIKKEITQNKKISVRKSMGAYVTATAYSSTRSQTDNDPCTTANGFNVCKNGQENVIAANFLPFGTRVKFPEIYGDRIFIVQDRMNRRFSSRVDFWMKSYGAAKQFGVKQVRYEIVPEQLAVNIK